ncbi:hypothetical protein Tco_0370791 [Tanacetum coccineum]
MRLVKHSLEECEFESEIQLKHEREDELVMVVVKVVHECRHWIGLGGTSEMLSSKGFKVFDGVFGGVGDEEVVVGEGAVRLSSSFVRSTNSCFGGMMVSLIFLKPLEEEA